MKKIVIADDEFLVRFGLKTTINWKENDFLIVGDAKNGREAMELFEKFDPDILLTDIKMPLMDGLELIQVLKKRKKSLKTVILSHYDDFAYAQEALKLGASEYMLKSDLSSENLLAVLRKLAAEIDLERGVSNEVAGDCPVEPEDPLQLDAILKKIVDGGCNTRRDLAEYLSQYKNMFTDHSFAFVYGILQEIHQNGDERQKEFISGNIANIAKQEFEKREMIYGFNIFNSTLAGLMNWPDQLDEAKILDNLSDACLQIKKNLKQFLDIELNIGLSKVGHSPDELLDLWKQAKTAQEYCFFDPSGLVIFEPEMLKNKALVPSVNLDILKGCVLKSESGQLTAYIDAIFANLFETQQIRCVKDVFIDLLSFAKILVKELGLTTSPALNKSKFSYSIFDELYSFAAVKQYLTDIYVSIAEINASSKHVVYSFVINKSIDFIKQNYGRNISLEDVAEHVEISKSYLSLLFKQETGINFSVFLTNYRIEMAKKLLISSNEKIYEVAGKVGFDNPYYFSKVFRGITGMSCKEYKRKYYNHESLINSF